VAATQLMTRHRVMQELRHSESFALGVLPPVLTQIPEVPERAEDSHWIKEDTRQWIVNSGKNQRKDE
jgi:hypothetical protein